MEEKGRGKGEITAPSITLHLYFSYSRRQDLVHGMRVRLEMHSFAFNAVGVRWEGVVEVRLCGLEVVASEAQSCCELAPF